MQPKGIVWFVQEMPKMEPPPELLMALLPYQKEFLAWAVQQERGVVKGGILADEMGMGKTIQVKREREGETERGPAHVQQEIPCSATCV